MDKPVPDDLEEWMVWATQAIQRLDRRGGGVANATITGDGAPVRVPPSGPAVGDGVPVASPATSPEITVTGDAEGVTIVAKGGDIASTTLLDYYFNGTLFETTTSRVVRWTAAETGMVADTDYPFWVVARNELGSADPSPTVLGHLDPNVTQETVLAWVAIGFLLAGEISVGNISIRPATPTDPGGIQILLNSGGVIWFPADGSDATITARLFAQELEVRGNMRILGDTNDVLGGLWLGNSVEPPLAPPAVATTWTNPEARTNIPEVTQTGGLAAYMRNPTLVGAEWWVLHVGAADPVRFYDVDDLDGVEVGRLTPPGLSGVASGMTLLGSNWYVLVATTRKVHVYDDLFTTLLSTWTLPADILAPDNPSGYNTIDNDGTNLLFGILYQTAITDITGTREMRLASHTPTGARNWWVRLDTTMPQNRYPCGVWHGSADFGGPVTVVSYYGSAGGVGVLNYIAYTHSTTNGAVATRAGTKDWPRIDGGVSGYGGGLFWDGVRFHGVGTNKIIHYGSNVDASTNTYAYGYHNESGGETTPVGPSVSFTAPKRSWTAVQTNTAFAPADSVRIYIDDHEQADPGIDQSFAVYDSAFDLTGAAPELDNSGFEAIATPGYIASRAYGDLDPLTRLRGDGDSWLGDFHMSTLGTRFRARMSYVGPSGGITNNNLTPISFDTQDFEFGPGMVDLVADELIVLEPCLLLVDLRLRWNEVNTTGVRIAILDLNGVEYERDHRPGTDSAFTYCRVLVPMHCEAGDQISARKLHTAGVNTITVANARLAAYVL